ncbi:hypothetical protein EZS27_003951 [termite gut metagenome]|uniref:Uncharacterized protein n=1 Tax=termite gut metagenome TaxID=433724 RepID=A0A5J4SS24_9ZZZZ
MFVLFSKQDDCDLREGNRKGCPRQIKILCPQLLVIYPIMILV